MSRPLKLEILVDMPDSVREEATVTLAAMEIWDGALEAMKEKGLEFTHSQGRVAEKAKAAAPASGKKRGRPARTATAPLLDQAAE